MFFWVVKRKLGALQHLAKVDLLGMKTVLTLGRVWGLPFHPILTFTSNLPRQHLPGTWAPLSLQAFLLGNSGCQIFMMALLLEGYGTD